MRGTWLRTSLLLIAVIVVHDWYMAASGHDMTGAAPAATCDQVQSHHGHHGSHHGEVAPPTDAHEPVDMAEVCSDLRAVAPLNREMVPDHTVLSPVGVLPDSTLAELFAATSRDIVESPPLRPPSVFRAWIQVYRI